MLSLFRLTVSLWKLDSAPAERNVYGNNVVPDKNASSLWEIKLRRLRWMAMEASVTRLASVYPK